MSESRSEDQNKPQAQPPARWHGRELGAITAIVATFVIVALAAVWPWRIAEAPVSASLDRYAPSFDGWSALNVKQDAAGNTLLWQGVNRRHLRSVAAYANEITGAQRDAIENLFTDEDVSADAFLALIADAQVIHERVTELDASGAYTQTLNLRLRNAQGEFIVSLDAAAPERELILDPPMPVLPAELRPDARWEGAGLIGAQATYAIRGDVKRADPQQGPLGAFDDCLAVNIAFTIALGEQTLDDRRWTDTYCAGVGLAREDETDPAGTVTRWIALAVNGANGSAGEVAALPTPTNDSAPTDEGEWQLTRVGRYASGIDTAATIAPVYLPALPALLVASHGGDLIALDVASDFADPIWRFSPGGTVYGQPAVDPHSGRIYFGASDRRLYALDSHGVYLWSFATGDNVATQPALFDGLVIFGSEDRNVYAVDAATGTLRWRFETGGAVVSAPAVATVAEKAVVTIGSDGGVAYGLDARTGAQVWLFETGKAIEAPSVLANDIVLVTSTAGTVSALDPRTGEEHWTADVSARAVRFAPAIAEDRLAVVDQQGYLSAYSLADGRRLWQSLEFDYLAAPLLVGDTLFVAGSGAVIHEVDLDGRRRRTWPMADASDATDTAPRLDFGPVGGGGALWTVDGRSVVRRIGAGQGGPARLRLDWTRQVNEPPFAMDLLRAAPVEWQGRGLVVDEGGRVVTVESETGDANLLFALGVEAARIEPVIAGDLLILTRADGLTAIRLTDGATAWTAQGGTSARPPVVSDGVVFWSASRTDGTGARIAALDAQTGDIRWTREHAAAAVPGGVTVAGGAVYASEPVARLDFATGETVWEASELTGGNGSPTLSPDGGAVYVGRLDPITGGEIVALDVADGAIVWRAPLGQDALSLLERPWVAGDALVIPTLSGSVIGLDAATGALRWQADLPAPRFGAATVQDDKIYMALTNGQVVTLSAEDGRLLGRGGDAEGGLEGYAFAQRPLILGNGLIVSFGSSLRGYALPEARP